MHNESVVAVYENIEQARLAAHELESSDFPTDQVSLVASNLENLPAVEADLEIGEDNVKDLVTGAGLGSLIGVLAGASLFVFGGVPALVIGAMAGLLTGAATGTFLGAMEGWGVHGDRVKHYESLVKAGHPLIVTHGDPQQLARAHHVLQQTETKELHLYASSDDDAAPSAS